jgi:hypothetical protein
LSGMSYLLSGLYAALGVVFAVSAVSKVGGHATFVTSLRPLPLVPHRLVWHVAAAVTAVEIVLPLGLGWAIVNDLGVVPPSPVVGVASLVLAGVLLSILTTGIALALHRGGEATCVCFGPSSEPLSLRHLFRNGILIGLVLIGLVLRAVSDSRNPELGGVLVAVAGGIVLALALVHLTDLIDLLWPRRAF